MAAAAQSRQDVPLDVRMRRTPVQSRSAQTIACILEAASELIGAGGGAYTTNAVAARAGVSIGTLYQYFPNKDALTAALILRTHQRIADNLHAVLIASDGKDLATALAGAVDVAITTLREDGPLHRALEVEEDRLPRSEALTAVEARIEALNAQILDRYLDPTLVRGEARALVAQDVSMIMRSVTPFGAARIEGELGLRERLHRAVLGYLAPLCRRETVGALY